MSTTDFSVYLHFPYCLVKCPYCDFYSAEMGQVEIQPAEYLALVMRELEILSRVDERLKDRRVVTLYIGGGTPSLADPDDYGRFFERLRGVFEVASSLEWTIEANPGTLDPLRLRGFRGIGMNRFSIGVQSFHDDVLKTLGRSHRSGQSRALLQELARADSPNLDWGIDLIFGVPDQTLAGWLEDLEEAIHFRPRHCSVYCLTIHEGTRFAEMAESGQIELPDEELQREMFLAAKNILTRAGYNHYEISNYAVPGFESRHNRRYWTGDEYLGLGVAAHSFLGGERWANPADLRTYGGRLAADELPRLPEPQPDGRSKLGELVMLGLRQLEGIDLTEFKSRFGSDLMEAYSVEIDRLSGSGLIEVAGGRLRLTEEGLLVADSVMVEFF